MNGQENGTRTLVTSQPTRLPGPDGMASKRDCPPATAVETSPSMTEGALPTGKADIPDTTRYLATIQRRRRAGAC